MFREIAVGQGCFHSLYGASGALGHSIGFVVSDELLGLGVPL
jgi:hypothetical protein